MTALVWIRRDLRVRDNVALGAALDEAGQQGGSRLLLRRAPLLRAPRLGPADPVPARVPGRAARRAARARRRALHPPREARGGVAEARKGVRRDRGPLRLRREPVRAQAREAHPQGVPRRRPRGPLPPGAQRDRRPRRHRDQAGEALHRLLPVPPHVGGDRTPRRPRGARRGPGPERAQRRQVAEPRVARPGAGGAATRRPAARRPPAGGSTPSSIPTSPPTPTTTTPSARTAPRGCLHTCHFGCISTRQIEERLVGRRGKGPAAFHRQLCWRDFHHHVLFHFPRNARSEHRDEYRGIKWSYAKKPFEAWCEGRTGYPLVDAAMRQLLVEGWITTARALSSARS